MGEGSRTIGQLVAKARRRKGWSQLRLATEVSRSESWVTKLETGLLQLDSVRMARQLGALLDLEPATLLGLAATDSHATSIVVDSPGVTAQTLRARLLSPAEAGERGEVQRRRFLELSARLASGLLAWQVLNPDHAERLLHVLQKPTRLDTATIDNVAKVAAAWHRSYWSVPAARLLPNVEGQLAIIDQLRVGATSDTHRVRLAVAEAELARLAGVINAQDRQDRTAARRHYTRALELAESVGSHSVAAYAVGGISFLEVYGGDPRAARRLANQAAAHAGRTPIPGLRCWVALIGAHAHASLGQATETAKHLGAAKDYYGAARTADEPAWLGFLTEQFIASDEGACLVKLGRGRQAVAVLDQALIGLPTSALKLRSVILANRAAALRLTADLDEACRTAGEALAVAAPIDYSRITHRVRELHASLGPRAQSDPAARELHEQLVLLAPTWH